MKALPLFCLMATPVLAETPVLTVYTYDSFATEWGPGPAIKAGFEETCNCDLQFVPAGDGAALLARLRLEGEGTDADVLLGIDQNLIPQARESGLLAATTASADYALPMEWKDTTFIPFDWGAFAFVSGANTPAPASLAELANSDLKVVIQDPRSSTPGLGLALWVEATQDDPEAFWADMADNVVTVTPGWSEAYALFLEGEADAVLSYTTSPAYHIIAEEDESKTFWTFDDGHYIQVEVAAKVGSTDQPELADAFLAFLVSDAAQSVIPTTNWMMPAVSVEGLPEVFRGLIGPSLTMMLTPESELPEAQRKALAAWQAGLSR